MGTHTKNSKQRIYSSFACRLGKIIKQYEELKLEEGKKYETTLYVCVLQNLVTQFRALSRAENSMIDTPLPIWGLESSQISRFPNPENSLTLSRVITHIRDALSHPWSDNRFVYEDTTENGTITGYTFQKPREFKITIPIENLRILVFELSHYLSAELEENKSDEDYC